MVLLGCGDGTESGASRDGMTRGGAPSAAGRSTPLDPQHDRGHTGVQNSDTNALCRPRPGRGPAKGRARSDGGRHHGPAGTRAGRRHGGEGRRALAPFAGAALALALLAGCGDGGQEAPEQEPPAETTAQDETDGTASEEETDSGEEADPTDESTAPEGDDPTDPPPGNDPSSDAPTDPPTSEDPPEEEPTDDSPSGENLFEGTWGFGHDSKVLSAGELSALLKQEAEARGPEE